MMKRILGDRTEYVSPHFENNDVDLYYTDQTDETALFVRALVQLISQTGMECSFLIPPIVNPKIWDRFL